MVTDHTTVGGAILGKVGLDSPRKVAGCDTKSNPEIFVSLCLKLPPWHPSMIDCILQNGINTLPPCDAFVHGIYHSNGRQTRLSKDQKRNCML